MEAATILTIIGAVLGAALAAAVGAVGLIAGMDLMTEPRFWGFVLLGVVLTPVAALCVELWPRETQRPMSFTPRVGDRPHGLKPPKK